MKHEETNDITSVTIEATDERSSVLAWFRRLNGGPQPVVVVLPEDAVLRRPGDLRELKQVIANQGRQLVLVLEGNERLRLWARRQGYSVFSQMETCLRALLPARTFHTTGPLSETRVATHEKVLASVGMSSFEFRPAQTVNQRVGRDTQGETSLSPFPARNSRRISGQLQAPARVATLDVPRTTGLSDEETWVQQADQISARSGEQSLYYREREPLQLSLVSERSTPVSENAIPNFSSRNSVPEPFSFYTTGSTLKGSVGNFPLSGNSKQTNMSLLEDMMTQPLSMVYVAQRGWSDKLMMVLVSLLILGILGGVGFGYLLSLVHAAPGLPVSASYIYR